MGGEGGISRGTYRVDCGAVVSRHGHGVSLYIVSFYIVSLSLHGLSSATCNTYLLYTMQCVWVVGGRSSSFCLLTSHLTIHLAAFQGWA
jgi:hypothetical protein